MNDNLSLEVLERLKTETQLNYNIKLFDCVDSTNFEAIRQFKLNNALSDKTVFISDMQTNAVGQLDHKWYSPEGSIFMTIFLKPLVGFENLSKLTLLTGFSLCKTINNITALDVKIKRPNDIIIKDDSCDPKALQSNFRNDYFGYKKLAGILSKSSLDGEKLNYVIVGIGLNVNVKNFPQSLSHIATSVLNESGKFFDRNKFIIKILSDFDDNYELFLKDQNVFLEQYEDLVKK